jgi:YHS domain-containing protein
MKTALTLAIAIVASVLTSSLRAEEIDLTGIKCPITGKQAVAKGKVAYKGKSVYTCCTKCPKAFAADPDKFAIKANAQLVATKQAVQVGCPISGKKVDPKWQVEVAGTKIGFCCKVCCKKAAEAKDDAQLELVFANFDKGFTTQTTCPMTKKPIDPACFSEKDGKKTFFCCGKCKAAFDKKSE